MTEKKLPNPHRILSEEIKSLRAYYDLSAEAMAVEIGAKIRMYRDLESGEYDKSKTGRQEKYWTALRILRETGPRFTQMSSGDERLKKLEDEVLMLKGLIFDMQRKLGV